MASMPDVDLTGCAKEPVQLGNWRLVESRGGYESRFSHLLLCYGSDRTLSVKTPTICY